MLIANNPSKPPKIQASLKSVSVVLVGLILLLAIMGWLIANNAAKNYRSNRSQTLASLQPLVKQTSKISFSSSMNVTATETDAQYAAEQTSCNLLQTESATASKTLNNEHSLSSDPLTQTFGFLSGSYRQAKNTQKSDGLREATTTLQAHLSRLAHACRVYTTDVGYSKDEVPTLTAETALLETNGQNGVTCFNNSPTCLTPNGNATAYKALLPGEYSFYDKEYALYSKQCDYPELATLCKAELTQIKQNNDNIHAYGNALPSGDYDAVSAKIRAYRETVVKSRLTILQQAVPDAVNHIDQQDPSQDVSTLVIRYLMQQDEQAIHTASSKLQSLR